jgi:hypothetical protein
MLTAVFQLIIVIRSNPKQFSSPPSPLPPIPPGLTNRYQGAKPIHTPGHTSGHTPGNTPENLPELTNECQDTSQDTRQDTRMNTRVQAITSARTHARTLTRNVSYTRFGFPLPQKNEPSYQLLTRVKLEASPLCILRQRIPICSSLVAFQRSRPITWRVQCNNTPCLYQHYGSVRDR